MPSKAREIVRMASLKAKAFPSIESHLFQDSRGFFENQASELLDSVSEKARELGVLDKDRDEQIATMIYIQVLESSCE